MKILNSFFENCKWIGSNKQCQSPIITRKFFVQKVSVAKLTLTGLGYFEATINGLPVTDWKFLPVASDYEKRDGMNFLYPVSDITTNRIYCYEFDILKLLHEGENCLEIQLGNGWYRQTERIAEGEVSYGNLLKTVYRLDIVSNGITKSFYSDGSELWRESEIRYNNIFHGEIINPNEIDGTQYNVDILPAPDSLLCSAIGTPDKEIRQIIPTLLKTVNGKKIFDVGENISGIVRIRTSAKKGERIVLRFSELLNNEGELDFASVGGTFVSRSGKKQIMQDEFISDGNARYFEPKFVWHAFRYFDISGDFDELEVVEIHSDCPVISDFTSDSEGLNFLYEAFLRSQLGNMHGSFPSDCPHRERLGYTGDGQLCAPAAMLTLDCREFYRKWIRDILDCQDINGHVQHTAPFMGGGGGPGVWGSAIVFVPYAYYLHYGDESILHDCYLPMRKWIKYLSLRCEDGLIVREEEGGWCLGDWGALHGMELPEPYVNTCCFIKILQILEKIAVLMGKSKDIIYYKKLRVYSEYAVIERYRDDNGITFLSGKQGADAFAVWCGIAGEKTVKRLVDKYDAMTHFDTGILGTDILLEVLFLHGHADTAFKLLNNNEVGSFLYIKNHDGTTLWENWVGGMASRFHPMFGACARQLFTSILGIRQIEGSVGYRHIVIAPQIPENLSFAEGSIRTELGTISVSWKKTNGKTELHYSVPNGVTVEKTRLDH